MALLGFYNGITGSCDIVPDSSKFPDDILGYPRERCEALLAEMRMRYPQSTLWKLEEGRMQSSKKNIHEAIRIFNNTDGSKMKQASALNMV